MALQRGAGAEGNDGRIVPMAQPHDGGDFPGGLGKGHRIGRGGGMEGLVATMLLQYGSAGGKAIAEQLAQRLEQLGLRRCTGHQWGNAGHADLRLQ